VSYPAARAMVPGGAGFRRAPGPISDRPVPTQGNDADTEMDRRRYLT
jgi:hypothetical protein